MNSEQHFDKQHMAYMKRAEVLSSLGAGVLGAGIGLLLHNILASFALPILLIGLVSHSVGMYQMQSHPGQENVTNIWWFKALYWFCWLVMAALLLYIVFLLI